MKQTIAAAGLCLLALSTTPLAAQTPAGTQCQSAPQGVDTVRPAPGDGTGLKGHVKVFDGATATTTGGVRVATGDINGDGAAQSSGLPNAKLSARKTGGDGAASQSSNNLKQLSLATNTCN
ncbi:hypothetical protein U1839_25275 [Sphingomonas sp. RT2P30]|uniref:hypothetical protein n=1 Tax=Parasphingomonas halimpatiens TaxID=3096162 RepID=UPI002FC98D65